LSDDKNVQRQGPAGPPPATESQQNEDDEFKRCDARGKAEYKAPWRYDRHEDSKKTYSPPSQADSANRRLAPAFSESGLRGAVVHAPPKELTIAASMVVEDYGFRLVGDLPTVRYDAPAQVHVFADKE
jgi:hypothetical protein